MSKVKVGLIVGCIAAALIVALLSGYRQAAQAEGPKAALARAVYITASKACACTLKRCQAADAVVAQVFAGARQRLLSRVDMAGDKDAAASYIQKYHVVVLPSLLLLDGQGKLLWSAQGEMNREDITKQLGQLGG
jgi:hypothetical protein